MQPPKEVKKANHLMAIADFFNELYVLTSTLHTVTKIGDNGAANVASTRGRQHSG